MLTHERAYTDMCIRESETKFHSKDEMKKSQILAESVKQNEFLVSTLKTAFSTRREVSQATSLFKKLSLDSRESKKKKIRKF